MPRKSMEDAIKELQETAIVMAGMQARHAKVVKEHSQWLEEHDRAMVEMREHGRRVDDRIEKLGDRIDKLVVAIGEFIRQRNGK